MKYEMNLGRLTVARPRDRLQQDQVFRLAVFGDFSGRANSGDLETGSALTSRTPHRVHFENLDDVLARFSPKLVLPIGPAGATLEVDVESMDDFHPDELYDKLDLFSELSELRRQLQQPSTMAKAAKEVQAWLGDTAPSKPPRLRARPAGSTIPRGKLSDFARLIGQDAVPAHTPTPAGELIKQIVSPHVEPATDPMQEPLVNALDQALTSAMRDVLHHPDFQAVESLWRSVELLTRRLEEGTSLQILLYDIAAEEIAADLSATDNLEETGLYQLLVEHAGSDQPKDALSVIVGNYVFERTPTHAELLGRLAQIAAAAQTPFIAGISSDCLKKQHPSEQNPLVLESWETLAQMPAANYLGLATPRFLLRWPYGAKTDPIDPFEFEEWTPQIGLKGMLWGNGAFLAGLLLGQTFSQQGLKSMQLGSIMTADDMPFYYHTDEYGDQVALPCTERYVNEPLAVDLTSKGLMPLLSIRNRPEVRLGAFVSVGGSQLAGPWSADQGFSAPEVEARAAPEELDSYDAEQEEPYASETGDYGETNAYSEGEDEASDEPSVDTEPAGDATDDLDALLAELDDADQSADDDEGMDPELESLLADL